MCHEHIFLCRYSRRPAEPIDMKSPVEIFTKMIKYVIAVAAILATVSGCVRAVELGVRAVGIPPVALVGSFVLGCIVTAAILLSRDED
jgi:hypothetical protein